MKIIGLLGGIASGKSMVAGQFARCGAKVLDADQIGHEVLRRPEIEAAVRERWGDKVFDADGRIDRRRLAQIVFGPLPDGPRERKCLEELTHPVIISVIKQELRTFAESGEKAVVLDAALLEEAGLDRLCDQLIYVDAPPTVRLQRALARGWREEDFAAREGYQKSLDLKRSRADVVIDNSGSSEQTQSQVERVWQTLVR